MELLETYHDRERMIAVLRYELEHPGKISSAEQIEAMNYGHGDGIGGTKGHISNKTLYIALNYLIWSGGRRSCCTISLFSESVRRMWCG